MQSAPRSKNCDRLPTLGTILAMLADTMVPEAFEQAHDAAGLITVAGFLASFALSKLGG